MFAFFFIFLPQLVLPRFDLFPSLYLFFLPIYTQIKSKRKKILVQVWSGTLALHIAPWFLRAIHKDKDPHLTKKGSREGRKITPFQPVACFLFAPSRFLNNLNNPIRPSGVKHPMRVRSFPWCLKISGKHLPSSLHDDKIDVDAEVLNIPLASLLTLSMCSRRGGGRIT